MTEATATPLYVEFDLPPEFWTRDPDGRYVVTGFEIGYFAPGAGEPDVVVDVSRDDVIVSGSAGRVAVDRPLAAKTTVRLQTVTGDAVSEWSVAASSGRPDAAAVANASPPRATRAAREARASVPRASGVVSEGDLHAYPRLLELARSLLPANADLGEILKPFQRVDQFAQVVVICRDHDVPLDEFVRTLAAADSQPLRTAIDAHVTGAEQRGVIVAARQEARALLMPSAD